MQIVIDMSEHEYEVALRDGWVHRFYSEKIKNGTPLPKGHGRLIDYDALAAKAMLYAPREFDGLFIDVKDLRNAQTIIEADKE